MATTLTDMMKLRYQDAKSIAEAVVRLASEYQDNAAAIAPLVERPSDSIYSLRAGVVENGELLKAVFLAAVASGIDVYGNPHDLSVQRRAVADAAILLGILYDDVREMVPTVDEIVQQIIPEGDKES